MTDEELEKLREDLIYWLQHPSFHSSLDSRPIPYQINRDNDDELRGAIHLIDYILLCMRTK